MTAPEAADLLYTCARQAVTIRQPPLRRDFTPFVASALPIYRRRWTRSSRMDIATRVVPSCSTFSCSRATSVDDSVAVQHLPTTITGNHADYDGPGNRYSIGIEMCENTGNSRQATLKRTARLTAWLGPARLRAVP